MTRLQEVEKLIDENLALVTQYTKRAAETIDRLGRDAQDCKSCARLPMCNAYRVENRFENCDYVWQYADIAEKIYNPEEIRKIMKEDK